MSEVTPDCAMPEPSRERTQNDALRAENQRLRDERDRLVSAIVWALGYGTFRERQEGEGPYWWRRELMHRSGLSQADLDKAWELEDTADKLTEVMMQHKAAMTPAGGGRNEKV